MNIQIDGSGSHIDHIYQAAVEPEHWPVFLETLSREVGAASTHLLFRVPSDNDRGIVASVGMDEGYAGAYRSYFYRLNPWRPFGPEAREGEVLPADALVPESELVQSEFYNDWLRPQRIGHPFVGFLVNRAPGDPISDLVAYREEGSGPFDRESLELVRRLIPHLQRALVIHDRVSTAELRAGAAADALDRVVGGVILLDERGTPVVTNRTADRILAEGDGLVLDPDGPRASSPQQTGELRRAVVGAARTGARQGAEAGAVLRLVRPSGRPALEAVVTPICGGSSQMFHERAMAAIFVGERDAQAECPVARLRRIYGLTAMEAEVASRLARGVRLSEIGDEFGVTIHTVRGHLKQLFDKTGTHRQADLIRVLLAGPARLRLD